MRVLIGVTGSIAAYKAAELVSELKKSGWDITVVMTEHAQHLVGPATFRALSGGEVRTDLFERWPGRPIHIDLAAGHDVIAVVPATANVIGKIAAGICDDLLSTVVLSSKAPVVIAPAMNEAMYLNPAVQANIETLRARGYTFVEPESGWLACGSTGKGRLAALDALVAAIVDAAAGRGDLKGRKVIVTGGPTLEPIDAVRFISNRSSGKMAAALARVAVRRGADTVMVMGPTSVSRPAGVSVLDVETGADMQRVCTREWQDADCMIMAAAVCDFRPRRVEAGKIKRRDGLTLELESSEDIIAGLASGKAGRVLVGFALETENEIEEGKRKLRDKGLDLVVVNNPLREGAGFGGDTNTGHLIFRDGRVENIPLMTKLDLAEKIFDAVASLLGGAAQVR
jgi:phosphopantothenoylcysteine decarboxylase/phosphopantothenate--cysteine ligase